jgi:SOS response regulatory protein OraA/RecX
LSETDPEAEVEAAMAVAAKKRRLSQYQDQQRLIAYLGRQGFGYEIIKKALARLEGDF